MIKHRYKIIMNDEENGEVVDELNKHFRIARCEKNPQLFNILLDFDSVYSNVEIYGFLSGIIDQYMVPQQEFILNVDVLDKPVIFYAVSLDEVRDIVSKYMRNLLIDELNNSKSL